MARVFMSVDSGLSIPKGPERWCERLENETPFWYFILISAPDASEPRLCLRRMRRKRIPAGLRASTGPRVKFYCPQF